MSKIKKNKNWKLPKTVQQSIPYKYIYANGMIETEDGVFTKAYRLEDINFKIAPDDEQISIFQTYGSFLNNFSDSVQFQIVIFNHSADKRKIFSDIRFDMQRDGLNKLRQDMNAMLIDKLADGRSNLSQEKAVIVRIESDDPDKAAKQFENIDKEIDRALRKIARETVTVPYTIEERLHIMHQIYNQDGQSVFNNDIDKNGRQYFNLNKVYKYGISSKDVIGPSGFEFKPNYFKIGETYGRSFYLEQVPNWLSTEYLSELTDISANMLTSIYYAPIDTVNALKMINRQLMNVTGQIAEDQKRAGKSGYSADLINPKLERSKQQTMSLMEDVVGRDQKLFYVKVTVTIFAETKESLDAITELVCSVSSNYQCPLKTLQFQQEQGLNASLPLCINDLNTTRLLTTESASVFIPFTSQELHQKNGIYYGRNQTTKNLILYSRLSGRNFNGLILGESGSGKSFMAKCEMISVLLRNAKNQVYVIDPEAEYVKMADALNGDVIDLSATSRTCVNPLDMDLDYGGDGDPVALKSDYITSMVEIMLGSGRKLDPRAKSVVDRCVQNIYRGYLQHMDELRMSGSDITCDKEAMPTLLNLYQNLMEQPEEEAHTVARIIEIYAKGTLGTFSHRTNVNTDAKFVVYDINNLGTGMKDLGLHICLNDIWNKMIENRKKDIWTWIYIDEFYLLLQSESTAKFLMQVWKRARKWNGVPTGIMQNTEDLLANQDARNIVNNTSFVIMMALSKIDRSNLIELLQIPESQMEYITNSQPGNGLIYTGKTVLPFNNEYDETTELYNIMSTSGSKDRLQDDAD